MLLVEVDDVERAARRLRRRAEGELREAVCRNVCVRAFMYVCVFMCVDVCVYRLIYMCVCLCGSCRRHSQEGMKAISLKPQGPKYSKNSSTTSGRTGSAPQITYCV